MFLIIDDCGADSALGDWSSSGYHTCKEIQLISRRIGIQRNITCCRCLAQVHRINAITCQKLNSHIGNRIACSICYFSFSQMTVQWGQNTRECHGHCWIVAAPAPEVLPRPSNKYPVRLIITETELEDLPAAETLVYFDALAVRHNAARRINGWDTKVIALPPASVVAIAPAVKVDAPYIIPTVARVSIILLRIDKVIWANENYWSQAEDRSENINERRSCKAGINNKSHTTKVSGPLPGRRHLI